MTTIPPKPRTTTDERLRVVDPDAPKRVEDPPKFDPDAYRPALTGDADDLRLLPQQVRMLASEVRDLSSVIHGIVAPALKRIEEWMHEHERYVAREFRILHARLDALEGKLGAQ